VTRGPRNGHAWRTVSARVRREEPTCWLCLLPIDPAAAPRSPLSFSVDHVIPLHHNGPLLDRANLRAAHLRCNVLRSKHCELCKPRPSELVTSRAW
jgi:5-methylcytosine-specific restriction endonuclease McrA